MHRLAPLFLVSALALFLAGCSQAPAALSPLPTAVLSSQPLEEASPSPKASVTAPVPSATPAPSLAPGWWEDLTVEDLPTSVATAEAILTNDRAGQVFLLADLPGPDLSLYGLGGQALRGVLLRSGNALTYFDQCYLPTVSPLLPDFRWKDFDGDGQNELAVRYLVLNSAENSVFELHIYEQDGDSWTDQALTEPDINSRLSERIQYAINYYDESITVTLDGTQAAISLEHLPAKPQSTDYPLSFTGRTFYRYENGKIFGIYSIGLMLEDTEQPWYIGQVQTDVTYDGQAFHLELLRIEPNYV